MPPKQQVNFKVDEDRGRLIADVAGAAGQTVTEFVSAAVEKEIQRRLSGKSGAKLKALLEATKSYRECLNGSESAP